MRVFAFAIVALVAGAACGASTPAATPSPTAAASSTKAAATPSIAATAKVPAKCAERVSDTQVSNALGSTVSLRLESPLPNSLTCGYDVPGGTPNPIAFGGRIAYQGLEKDPTQADVDALVAQLKSELGGNAMIQHISGVGDFAGWITLTLPNGEGTVWDLAASRGRLYVDFSTWSGFVSQPNQSAMSDVVRAALG